jgi:uncharacterized membrane protein YcaP (DUF421 family)
MFQVISQSFFKAVFAFLVLLIILRILGRKEISQMTLFDLGVAVTMGSVTANLAIGTNHTTLSVTVVLATFGLLALLLGYISLKSFRFRKLINSEPVMVVEKGRINQKNMGKIRLTLDELMPLLREKNVFNIADVEFAIMESDGELSVLPKAEKQPLTPSDLKIPMKYKGLTSDLIMDGSIMEENLRAAGHDTGWLMEQLEVNGIKDRCEVFYAGLDSQGNLYLSKRQKAGEKEGEHGID